MYTLKFREEMSLLTRPSGHLLRDITDRETEYGQLLRSIEKDRGTPAQNINIKQLFILRQWLDTFYKSLLKVNDLGSIDGEFNIAFRKAKSLLANVDETIKSLSQQPKQ